jgi:hypothetical protein
MIERGSHHLATTTHARWFRRLTVSSLLRRTRSPLPSLRKVGVSLVLAVTLLVGSNSPLAYGLGIFRASAALAAPAQGRPHHIDPRTGTRSVLHFPPPARLPSFPPFTQRPPMSHGFVPSMKPGLLPLDPNRDATFTGSDGRLEIDVPAGAVNASDVATAASGTLALRVTEIAPPSGSNAGNGVVSLGSYAVEVVDGQGNDVPQFAHGLRKALTLKLHYGRKGSALELDHAFVVFNGAHAQAIGPVGPYATQRTTHDRKNHVLQAQLAADPALTASATPPTATPTVSPTPTATPTVSPTPTATPRGLRPPHTVPPALTGRPSLAALAPLTQQTPLTTFTFDTYPPVATFGAPDPFNVDLNSGGLTDGMQLDVPPGPAGAMPNITLAYNSGAVSEQHSPRGATGWVGEGWSLSLGSISWAEHNVTLGCSSCSNSWESTWQLTDPFGTSTELIPPNLAASTYYDDSTNWWCTTGNTSSDTCPIQFHTARDTYAKVYAYVGPTYLGVARDPLPCFRVYLTNGVMEEFGCTPDSLQYYPLQAGTLAGQVYHDVDYPINWLLDLITNPQGDQVHITYQADTETAPDGLTYPRDLVPATIEWDSPDCVSATQGCGSGTWHPHYRVQFVATHHTPARTTTTGTCNTDTTVRCDDPLNLTGSGQFGAPLVNGTFVLNDANVQTNPSGNLGAYNASTWNTVRDYQFSYEQSGPTTITDPPTGMQLSTAGYLDLTQVQRGGRRRHDRLPA